MEALLVTQTGYLGTICEDMIRRDVSQLNGFIIDEAVVPPHRCNEKDLNQARRG